MRKITMAIAAIMAMASTAAYAMDAETFYTKSVALQKKGMLAVFSGDVKLLMGEFKTASAAVRAENEKAKADGHPLYCAPEKSKISSDQIVAEFATIPASHRKELTVKGAWKEIVIRKYPC